MIEFYVILNLCLASFFDSLSYWMDLWQWEDPAYVQYHENECITCWAGGCWPIIPYILFIGHNSILTIFMKWKMVKFNIIYRLIKHNANLISWCLQFNDMNSYRRCTLITSTRLKTIYNRISIKWNFIRFLFIDWMPHRIFGNIFAWIHLILHNKLFVVYSYANSIMSISNQNGYQYTILCTIGT